MNETQEELQRAMGRVEGKIDMLLEVHRTDQLKCMDCEGRFDKLEASVGMYRNILFGLGAVASFLGVERVAKYLQIPFMAH